MGRGVLGRPARRDAPGRPGLRPRRPRGRRRLGRPGRAGRAPITGVPRRGGLRDRPAAAPDGARRPGRGPRRRPALRHPRAGGPHRARPAHRRVGVARRRRRRRGQRDAPSSYRRAGHPARGRQQPLPVVGHPGPVLDVHLRVRRHRLRLDSVPCVPVRRGHEHVHRRGSAGHLGGVGARGFSGTRPASTSSPTSSTRCCTALRCSRGGARPGGRRGRRSDASPTSAGATAGSRSWGTPPTRPISRSARERAWRWATPPRSPSTCVASNSTSTWPPPSRATTPGVGPRFRPLQDEAVRSSAWFEDPVGLLEKGDDLGLGWSLWQRRRRAPRWRWYLHRASQHVPVRRVRSSAGTLRRHVLARRRRWSAPVIVSPDRPRSSVGEERR